MESDQLYEVAINWAKKRGLTGIKANIENYETPASFMRNEGAPVVPDITGMQAANKCYVEIATKTEDVQELISKWKLLSTMAQAKGGKLYLLTPRGHKAFTENIVREYNLEARIISV